MDLLTVNLPGIPKVRSGKVREIFDLGDSLLIVATDRISAFDCILPNAIPDKGAVLNQLSAFWFSRASFLSHHIIATGFDEFPDRLLPFAPQLRGRAMIVRKTAPLPVECVVRGYLAGSGWLEYQQSRTICGQALPNGLQQAERLPSTMFTPSTKAESGHDINISWESCRLLLGDRVARKVRELSVRLYEGAREFAAARGIILADTKFEFGIANREVILIDECLTPDSSRFWPAEQYAIGSSPPSFDKQFVRDYLETLDWNKTPPAPGLPEAVVRRTSDKYREAYEKLTGQAFQSETVPESVRE